MFEAKGASVAIDHFSGETLYFWIGPGRRASVFFGFRFEVYTFPDYRMPTLGQNHVQSKVEVQIKEKSRGQESQAD